MKKWVIFVFTVFGILFLFYRWQAFDDQNLPLNISKENTKSSLQLGKKIKFKSNFFRYLIFRIEKSDNVDLIANFDNVSSSENLIKSASCQKAINGSFISEIGKPIGYFQTSKKTYSPPSQNALFIGYLLFDGEKFEINRDGPKSNTVLGLQSGPLLLEDGSVLPVSLKSDKPARRMIFGIAKNGFTYALTIFSEENELSGPLLDDLAKIVDLVSIEENIDTDIAINLDGGKHSMFFDGNSHIKELVGVGSMFCFR